MLSLFYVALICTTGLGVLGSRRPPRIPTRRRPIVSDSSELTARPPNDPTEQTPPNPHRRRPFGYPLSPPPVSRRPPFPIRNNLGNLERFANPHRGASRPVSELIVDPPNPSEHANPANFRQPHVVNIELPDPVPKRRQPHIINLTLPPDLNPNPANPKRKPRPKRPPALSRNQQRLADKTDRSVDPNQVSEQTLSVLTRELTLSRPPNHVSNPHLSRMPSTSNLASFPPMTNHPTPPRITGSSDYPILSPIPNAPARRRTREPVSNPNLPSFYSRPGRRRPSQVTMPTDSSASSFWSASSSYPSSDD